MTLLRSLANLVIPVDAVVELIICDNSENNELLNIEKELLGLNFPLTLLHVPVSNISSARNAIMSRTNADVLAFVDDDETVHSEWLTAGLSCLRKFPVVMVLGPTIRVFQPGVSERIQTLLRKNIHPSGLLHSFSGGTGNMFLQMGPLRRAGVLFDEDFGQSGGEDSEFIIRVCSGVGPAYWASDCIVYEHFTTQRTKIGWAICRNIRAGGINRILNARQGVQTPWGHMLKSPLITLFGLAKLLIHWSPSRQWADFLLSRAIAHAVIFGMIIYQCTDLILYGYGANTPGIAKAKYLDFRKWPPRGLKAASHYTP